MPRGHHQARGLPCERVRCLPRDPWLFDSVRLKVAKKGLGCGGRGGNITCCVLLEEFVAGLLTAGCLGWCHFSLEDDELWRCGFLVVDLLKGFVVCTSKLERSVCLRIVIYVCMLWISV